MERRKQIQLGPDFNSTDFFQICPNYMVLKPGYQSLPWINVSIFNKVNQGSESVFSPTFPPKFVSYKVKVRK